MEKIKEWWYYYKMRFIVISICSIVLVLCIFGIFIYSNNNRKVVVNEVIDNNLKKIDEVVTKDDTNNIVYVDVKGAVLKPGIYSISAGSRVNDAINLAGVKSNADLSVLNLSKKVFDEMVIIVYTKSEVNDFIKVVENTLKKIEICKEDNTVINNACIDKNDIAENFNIPIENSNVSVNSKKVSLNNATVEELMTLSGVGESKAKTIIEYRNSHLFTDIEELKNVKGIGESLYEKVKDFITV